MPVFALDLDTGGGGRVCVYGFGVGGGNGVQYRRSKGVVGRSSLVIGQNLAPKQLADESLPDQLKGRAKVAVDIGEHR